MGGGAVDIGASGSVTNIKGTLTLGGTSITATAAQLNTYILNVALDNINSSTPCFVVAPKAGTITKITSIINDVFTGSEVEITANVNGGQSDITEIITITSLGSGPGVIDSCTPSVNNTVTAGQYIKLTSSAGGSGIVKAVFTIEITY